MNVFVYKEYNDEDAYGEEIIKVFANRGDALDHLKMKVEEHFGVSFHTIPDNTEIFNKLNDSFAEDYVSIDVGNSVIFWVVEEQPVLHGTA